MNDDGLDDDLRVTMRAHAEQAPSHLEWAPPRRDRGTWLLVAAAAAVVLTVVGLVVALGRRSDPDAPPSLSTARHRSGPPTSDGALTCPATSEQPDTEHGTVPAKPIGVNGSKQLVPDRTPTTVTICRYRGHAYIPRNQTRTIKLTGRRELAGALRQVTESLAQQPTASPPRGCLAYLSPLTDGDDYLIGITYGAASLWVAAPGNHCSGATNGQFATAANLRDFAADAYRAGHWISQPPSTRIGFPGPRACHPTDVGRLGQEKTMVPPGYTTLTVCDDNTKKHASLTVSDAEPIVAALNDLPTRTSDSGCKPHSPRADSYTLVARYPSGPAVDVMVWLRCYPPVDNGALQATSAGSVQRLIEAALR